MSRQSTFLLCERCKDNIYPTRAIDHAGCWDWEAGWYCKHCAKALKII